VKRRPPFIRGFRQMPARRTTRSFRWDTGHARSWRTTLTVQFQPAGLDIDAGCYLPNRYEAVLSNSRLPVTTDGSASEMMPFDLTIAQAAVPAPTVQALDRFSEAAVRSLRRRYFAGDPSVCGYFAGPLPARRPRWTRRPNRADPITANTRRARANTKGVK
jgi:hypothetical protein